MNIVIITLVVAVVLALLGLNLGRKVYAVSLKQEKSDISLTLIEILIATVFLSILASTIVFA